jgi:MAPEG family
MASMMIKTSLLAATSSFLESKYASKSALQGSALEGVALGLTPLIVVGVGLWSILHGFLVVNPARKKYMELAKKDGEANAEERYSYPNLYADGISPHAKAFNCVQRSHQHIFETFTQTVVAAMISWHVYPISSAVLMATYAVGRYCLSNGYATAEGGDASKRYSSPLAFLTWYGILALHFLGALSAFKMMLGVNMY